MGDSIEYCDKCENNVGCHINRGCLRLERRVHPPRIEALRICKTKHHYRSLTPPNNPQMRDWM